jgi:hypothetical protein
METMELEDMKLQEQMVVATGADMSFVKFRPPYVSSDRDNYHFSYLKGKVFFQVQNRDNSTECRLMITPQNSQEEKFRDKKIAAKFKTVQYDALKHEEQCAFINHNLRPDWDLKGINLLSSTLKSIKVLLPFESKHYQFPTLYTVSPAQPAADVYDSQWDLWPNHAVQLEREWQHREREKKRECDTWEHNERQLERERHRERERERKKKHDEVYFCHDVDKH